MPSRNNLTQYMRFSKDISTMCIHNVCDKTFTFYKIVKYQSSYFNSFCIHSFQVNLPISTQIPIPFFFNNPTETTTQWLSSQHTYYTNTSICHFTKILSAGSAPMYAQDFGTFTLNTPANFISIKCIPYLLPNVEYIPFLLPNIIYIQCI